MKNSVRLFECECGQIARKVKAKREFKRFGVTIEDIPAYICDSCGEIFFDGPSIARIERKLAESTVIAA